MQNSKKVHLLSGAIILSLALLVTGCQPLRSTTPSDGYEYTAYESSSTQRERSAAKAGNGMQIEEKWEERSRELVLDAASLAKGTPYVFGGTNLSGFDCSGFVRWAYDTIGVSLPRSAREQSTFGESVDRANLRLGDIVAFRHPKRGYHTGLYVGNGQFIHSPRRRDVVKVSSLTDPYFKGSYLGARRPAVPEKVDIEQVEKKLLAIKAQKKAIKTASLSKKRTADAKKASATTKKKKSSSNKKGSAASSTKKRQSAQKATTKKNTQTKPATTQKADKKTSDKKASNTATSRTAQKKDTKKSSSKKDTKKSSASNTARKNTTTKK